MKAEGKTVIMTTHKIKEVMASSRPDIGHAKGKMIYTSLTSQTNERELARLMVGKEENEPEERSYIVHLRERDCCRLISHVHANLHWPQGASCACLEES